MSYLLFLDDERQPEIFLSLRYREAVGLPCITRDELARFEQYEEQDRVVVARSHAEAVKIVEEYGCPEMVLFDHDLGHPYETGHWFAEWLVSRYLDGSLTFPENFVYFSHSANTVGRANITGLLDSFFKTYPEARGGLEPKVE